MTPRERVIALAAVTGMSAVAVGVGEAAVLPEHVWRAGVGVGVATGTWGALVSVEAFTFAVPLLLLLAGAALWPGETRARAIPAAVGAVGFALLVFHAFSIYGPLAELWATPVALAMFVALIKGSLVACFFMHLLTEKTTLYSILLLCVFFFAVLMVVPSVTEGDNVGAGVQEYVAVKNHYGEEGDHDDADHSHDEGEDGH